jgi:two-component system, OmpR family, KDP operon response regulator KdpE
MTAAMHRILIVEDEPAIRQVLRLMLEAESYRVIEAGTAERALIEARSHQPDAAIVDLGLPDRDGLEVIRALREWSTVPVLVLSARSMEAQKIAALDAGADDYVTKPFLAGELLARLRAALRRGASDGASPPTLTLGATTIDLARRTARRGDAELHLTPLEYRTLMALARHGGTVVTQQALMTEVWGPGRDGDTRNLRVFIKSLRGKLEPDPARPRYILTETGIGYRLRLD